jgi:hypothetical protein
MKIKRFVIAVSLGLGLTLALIWALGGRLPSARADSPHYVALNCTGVPAPCHATVQEAVDAAVSGDDIRVATGVYTGVQNVPALNTGNFTATQVVVITKNVTIRGGYSGNFTARDPALYTTTLNAQGLGRVLVISGAIAPTVEGLRLTGGDAAGLGGGWSGWDAGGGVYIYQAPAAISGCVVYSNTASTGSGGQGGGLCLLYSAATLEGNTIVSNTASIADTGYGGGLYIRSSNAALSGNTVQSNIASTDGNGFGGGLFLWHDNDAALSGNIVVSNTASTTGYGQGGGLYLRSSDAVLSSNIVQGNIASTGDWGQGGGLRLWYSDATLNGNTVRGNIASTANDGSGGGLYISSSDAALEGNTVQDNIASTANDGSGGGLYINSSDATLSGNTIISNTATLSQTADGQGGGLRVFSCNLLTLTNNLVVGNQANTAGLGHGGGLWFTGEDSYPTSGRLLHTTIAHNAANGGGQGVYVGDYTTLAFTNTIIAGHASVGITATAGSTVTLEATLWHDNGTHADGVVISHTNIYSDPLFADPAAWDYHLTAGSPAIDAGVDAGVTPDIDGDARIGQPDIGADEFIERIYLPLVLRNH